MFAGGLVSQDVRRIELDEAGNVIAQHSIPVGQRVRDIATGTRWTIVRSHRPTKRTINSIGTCWRIVGKGIE